MQNRLAGPRPDLFFGPKAKAPFIVPHVPQQYQSGPIAFARQLREGDPVTVLESGRAGTVISVERDDDDGLALCRAPYVVCVGPGHIDGIEEHEREPLLHLFPHELRLTNLRCGAGRFDPAQPDKNPGPRRGAMGPG